MTTQSSTGLIGSDTIACSGWLSIGRRKPAILAGHHDADLLRADGAVRGFEDNDLAAFDLEAGDLAILDDVHAARIGTAGIAPGDCVMARDATAALQAGTEHRIARCRRAIEDRAIFRNFLAGQDLGIDAVELDGVDAATQR